MCWTLNHQNILEMAQGHISLSAIAALFNATGDNTCFLPEMDGNQFHQQGGRGQPQGPRDTTYLEFLETRPPLFVKAEEPLEADEWIQVME
jgi:hypothetical protein